jgi:hypothetical protein
MKENKDIVVKVHDFNQLIIKVGQIRKNGRK